MKVVKMKNVVKEPAEMTGGLMTGTQVYRQAVLKPGDSKNFNFGIVSFSAGSRNKFHKHSSDQILIITEGVGKVATKDNAGKVKELTVRKGDVVVIQAGEDHWHGAPGGTAMAHITVTGNGSQTTQTEK
ncbi:MAG: cupin domain-containing protein [Dehalococcoidia bacterium]|nr:cupin domain-containing protein [Dehalococcoidia bacterium]MSQ16830.1 cupin domain-containing protein [Dehalococcoidia bacterium]